MASAAGGSGAPSSVLVRVPRPTASSYVEPVYELPYQRKSGVGASHARSSLKRYEGSNAYRSDAVFDNYVKTLLNPLDSLGNARWPDDVLAPTATTKMTSEYTYTTSADGTMACLLGWKLFTVAAAGAAEPGGVWPTIGQPQSAASFSASADYGAPQAAWGPLSTLDRSIASGIRVRLTNLAPGTFFKPGKLYFVQYSPEEFPDMLAAMAPTPNEAYFQQMVTASKGFTVTTQDADNAGGVTIPFLPIGPNSYFFSGTNAQYAAGNTTNEAVAAIQQNNVASANGGVLVIGFGCGTGTTFNVTMAHHIEFVPRVASAGLLSPKLTSLDLSFQERVQRFCTGVASQVWGANGIGPLIAAGLTSTPAKTAFANAARVVSLTSPAAGAAMAAAGGWATSAAGSAAIAAGMRQAMG